MANELTPHEVLVDLFEEMRADDPQHLAECVEQRLKDASFEIRPTDEKLPPTSRASHNSG